MRVRMPAMYACFCLGLVLLIVGPGRAQTYYSPTSAQNGIATRSYYNPPARHGLGNAAPQISSPAAYGQALPYSNGIVTVISTQVGSHVVLGGTVVPYRSVTLTAMVPGRVQYLAGEEGDRFRMNQTLAAVDDDDLMARRRAALAYWSAANADLRNARVQYSREFWSPRMRQQLAQQTAPNMGLFPSMFERFFGGGGAAGGNPWLYGNPWIERQADLYSQATQVSKANSQVWANRAKVDEVDAHLLDTRSIAPFDGVILKKLAEIGDTVQPGQPLLEYADTSDLQIQLDVPARLMPGIQKDMILPATLDVGDLQVNARVAQIYPIADSKRHTVTVKLDLPSGVPGGPGMYAEVSIPDVSAPVANLPVIPSSAIVWRGSLPAVFVLQENEPRLRLVRLGEQVDAQTVAVLSGLRPGEQIFASPAPGMSSQWKPRSRNGQ